MMANFEKFVPPANGRALFILRATVLMTVFAENTGERVWFIIRVVIWALGRQHEVDKSEMLSQNMVHIAVQLLALVFDRF